MIAGNRLDLEIGSEISPYRAWIFRKERFFLTADKIDLPRIKLWSISFERDVGLLFDFAERGFIKPHAPKSRTKWLIAGPRKVQPPLQALKKIRASLRKRQFQHLVQMAPDTRNQ